MAIPMGGHISNELSDPLRVGGDMQSVSDLPVHTRSAVDELVANIRHLISSQKLGVGDGLPSERELCERFATSRNTVREAMRMLKAYGMVEVRPKVGATIIDNRMARAFDLFSLNVMDVSRKMFSDVQGMRGLLEIASVDLMLDRVRENDLSELLQINSELPRIQTIEEGGEVDFRFHVRLLTILENRAILDVFQTMKPVIVRIMKNGKSPVDFQSRIHGEHLGILDALKARDRIWYQYATQSHLNSGIAIFDEGDETERVL